VQHVLRYHGLLPRPQEAYLPAHEHLQATVEHLEVLGVGFVIVGAFPPPGATSISMSVWSPPVSSLVSRKVA
jgi:hypothetical protein